MTKFADDLKVDVKKIFAEQWKSRDGQKVPEPEDVGLGNDAVKLKGTVLYADLSDSTGLVRDYKAWFAAEVYKAYLLSAARIIRSSGGVITAYDGDRVMAVFVGDSKNSDAATCGLKINYAVQKIVQPALSAQYEKVRFRLSQTVGIDTCDLWVARTGIRGSNDLVWVGNAANYAAKLTGLGSDWPTRISEAVYNSLRPNAKTGGNPKKNMWTSLGASDIGISVYGSSWRYPV